MHEFPLTQRIVAIAEEAARARGASRVTEVRLVVGELSGLVADSIEMYFDIVAQGTLVEGARLVTRGIKAQLWCEPCQAHFSRAPYSFSCPACGRDGVMSDVGKEFYVEAIDVE